jgi:predicted GNAT superfamily acetyltransferase
MELRTLTTIEEFRQVLALEQRVWGYTTAEDSVPAMILLVSSRVGGFVIGAFDPSAGSGSPRAGSRGEGGRLVGFAYSMPAVRGGTPYQWSHMLAVDTDYRDSGLGWRLKLEQRRLVMASGLDLVAWTFDPLQAANAHLNFAKLGIVAREYHEDAYPDSSSALHAGTATDRLVAEWWLTSGRVVERLDSATPGAARGAEDGRRALAAATLVNRVREGDAWIEPEGHDLALDAARLGVVVPTGFTEMQQMDLPLARDWRSATREMFETLLARGYVVEDFVLDRPARRGTYILARP